MALGQIRMTNGETQEVRLDFTNHVFVSEVLCRIQSSPAGLVLTFNAVTPEGTVIEDSVTVRIDARMPYTNYPPQEEAARRWQEMNIRQMRDNGLIDNIRLDHPTEDNLLQRTAEEYARRQAVELDRLILGTNPLEPNGYWDYGREVRPLDILGMANRSQFINRPEVPAQGRSIDYVVIDDIPQPEPEHPGEFTVAPNLFGLDPRDRAYLTPQRVGRSRVNQQVTDQRQIQGQVTLGEMGLMPDGSVVRPQPEETYREDHYEEGEEQDDPSLSLEPDQG